MKLTIKDIQEILDVLEQGYTWTCSSFHGYYYRPSECITCGYELKDHPVTIHIKRPALPTNPEVIRSLCKMALKSMETVYPRDAIDL